MNFQELPPFINGTNEELQIYHQDLNQSLLQWETELETNLSDLAYFLPPRTNAEVTAMLDQNFQPVLPAGAIWFNSTLAKLQFVTVAAVLGVSNGVAETVTST